MNVRVILEWDDEAESFSATCSELNFASSFGETKETAVENLKDAIALMLEPNQLLGAKDIMVLCPYTNLFFVGI